MVAILGGYIEPFSVAAARTSALNASASMSSPSPMSIARRVRDGDH
jgi:hypothetical protein